MLQQWIYFSFQHNKIIYLLQKNNIYTVYNKQQSQPLATATIDTTTAANATAAAAADSSTANAT